MRIMVLAGMAAAAVMASTVGTTAKAQMVLTQPGDIRACLCLQQSVTVLDGDVVRQRQAHEQQRQQVDALDAEVNAQRSQIDVNNFDQVQAFKHLIDQRDKAAADFAGPVTARYADAVARYNAAVNQFNGSCAGKAYDQAVLAQVQAGLACPVPR
jgi:TolA-binding protein